VGTLVTKSLRRRESANVFNRLIKTKCDASKIISRVQILNRSLRNSPGHAVGEGDEASDVCVVDQDVVRVRDYGWGRPGPFEHTLV